MIIWQSEIYYNDIMKIVNEEYFSLIPNGGYYARETKSFCGPFSEFVTTQHGKIEHGFDLIFADFHGEKQKGF